LLNDGLLNHELSPIGSFSVTATPPDRITTGQNEPNQLNLFPESAGNESGPQLRRVEKGLLYWQKGP
jgi:hypothetical protein